MELHARGAYPPCQQQRFTNTGLPRHLEQPDQLRAQLCWPIHLAYNSCSPWVSLRYTPPLPTATPVPPTPVHIDLGNRNGSQTSPNLTTTSETMAEVREALDVGFALRQPFTNIPAFAAWAIMVVAFLWMVVVRPKFPVPPYVGILATFIFAITVSQILQLHLLTSAVLAACAVVPAFWVYKQRRAF